jgi:hypothetical protein
MIITRNYWVVSPNVKNNNEAQDWINYIQNNGYAFIGYGEDNPQGRRFVNEVKTGDCIIVAQGANWRKRLCVAGIVGSDAKWEYIAGTPSDAYNRKLNPFITEKELQALNISFSTNNTGGESQNPRTIYRLKTENEADFEIIQKLEKRWKEFEMHATINISETLLRENKNLILTGAPGTGKTFIAKQLAYKLITGNLPGESQAEDEINDILKESRRFQFVQFHPSYDYTDFVEGLRPIQDDRGNVGFELKNGVFKEFCKNANRDNNPGSSLKWFDAAWESFLLFLDENSPLQIAEGFSVYLTPNKKVRDENRNYGAYTKDNIYNVYKGLKGRSSGAFNWKMKKMCDYLKKEFHLNDYVDESQLKSGNNTGASKNMPYVFVIDEINRGEISKIFGELFFSIDPGYRGKKGKVQTQYANMQSDETIFDEDEGRGWFYVPDNVYIIGTMNDIDRSVESFDFAMRRRFIWQEITSRESAVNMGLLPAAINKMNSLNAAISNIQGLNASYHIGAAYFLKKNNGVVAEPDYSALWELRLRPLLHEYLRGMPNTDSLLEDLHAAFISGKNTKDDT